MQHDLVLKDGRRVRIRPIRPGDANALMAFHGGLSPQTVYRRFFSVHPRLSAREATFFTAVDHCDRVALVAVDAAGALLGVARYDRSAGTDEAEVAFVIADAHQGRGLGSAMLRLLAHTARGHGISRFVADTLPDNRAMIHVFKSTGAPLRMTLQAGVVHVEFDLAEVREVAA